MRTVAQQHEVTSILMEQSTIKEVRFSIGKIFWADRDFYAGLDERIFGTLKQWVNTRELKPKILWDDGMEDTAVSLHELLPPEVQFKLEPYANGNSAPKRSRRTAAPAAPPAAADRRHVDIDYKVGNAMRQQRWFYETPEAIHVDARQDERQRPQINRESHLYQTAYGMFVHVALPMPWIKKMFGDTGYINQRLDGTSEDYRHRKTTVGEGIQFICYRLCIANNPGRPVRAMWQDKIHPGEKSTMPPPAIGRFGMSENRFIHLQSLVAMQFSVSEAELDKADPWRYCGLATDCFNEHWEEVMAPGWLLAPDESMAWYTGHVSDGIKVLPTDLPFLSQVPRKPKPLGGELKTTAEGECGAVIRAVLALKYKRARGQPQVESPYLKEWGATTAQCMELIEPWLNTNRCFGADAHFISIDSIEGLRLNVRDALTLPRSPAHSTCACTYFRSLFTPFRSLLVSLSAGHVWLWRLQADERALCRRSARAALRP